MKIKLYGGDGMLGTVELPVRPRIVRFQGRLFIQLPGSIDSYVEATSEIVDIEQLDAIAVKRTTVRA